MQTETLGSWRETNSKGVDIMVTLMGITGFVFWMVKSTFNLSWAIKITTLSVDELLYLRWSFAKNILRSIGILFQLYFFVKSDPFIGCRRVVKCKKISYFILPALMLSLLSVFIMTVIDSYSGMVEDLIAHSGISDVIMSLLKAGEPIHLGFCLHLFLHFFIINHNMHADESSLQQRRSRPASRAKAHIDHLMLSSNQRPKSTPPRIISNSNILHRQHRRLVDQSLLEPLVDQNNTQA